MNFKLSNIPGNSVYINFISCHVLANISTLTVSIVSIIQCCKSLINVSDFGLANDIFYIAP